MCRIKPEEVLQAYQELGFTPMTTNMIAKTDQGYSVCGLGAIACQRMGYYEHVLDEKEMDEQFGLDLYDVLSEFSNDYIMEFYAGFDRPDLALVLFGEREGVRDGVEARKLVAENFPGFRYK